MKIFIGLWGFVVALCLVSMPGRAITYAKEPTTPRELIAFFAQKYAVDEDKLLKVAICESSLNYRARGDKGYAVGIFQYHQPTFDMFSKEFGEDLNIQSSYDQAKLTAWAFSRGYQTHWTCWYKTNK